MPDTASPDAVPGRYGRPGAPGLWLQEATVAAAWNLQGNPADPMFAAHAANLLGRHLPQEPMAVSDGAALTALWLGPRSWLLVAGRSLPPEHPLAAGTQACDATIQAGGALFDVTAARIGWRLTGPLATTVLSSGCPLDLHLQAFPVGHCAQTLFGHVGALLVRHGAEDFTMLVARSYARGVWAALCATGAQHGYEVLAPAPLR